MDANILELTPIRTKAAQSFAWAAAKVTGAAHRSARRECEDAVGIAKAVDPSGVTWIVAAAADGAGTCSCAARASDIAVDSVLKAAMTLINEGRHSDLRQTLMSAAAFARTMLLCEAIMQDRSPADYLTTLLVMVSDGRRLACLQIGDGGIAVRDGSGAWSLVFTPHHGEFANTSRFLTEPDWLAWTVTATIDSALTDVVLFTDGLELLVVDGEDNIHPPLFELVRTLLAPVQGGEAFGASAALTDILQSSVFQNANPDDMSLAAIRLLPETA